MSTTTTAEALNRLYEALATTEDSSGYQARYCAFATYDGLKGGVIDIRHDSDIEEMLALDAHFVWTDDRVHAMQLSNLWADDAPKRP